LTQSNSCRSFLSVELCLAEFGGAGGTNITSAQKALTVVLDGCYAPDFTVGCMLQSDSTGERELETCEREIALMRRSLELLIEVCVKRGIPHDHLPKPEWICISKIVGGSADHAARRTTRLINDAAALMREYHTKNGDPDNVMQSSLLN
jgi:hypothetical protein